MYTNTIYNIYIYIYSQLCKYLLDVLYLPKGNEFFYETLPYACIYNQIKQ
jgi:hypothetical protein